MISIALLALIALLLIMLLGRHGVAGTVDPPSTFIAREPSGMLPPASRLAPAPCAADDVATRGYRVSNGRGARGHSQPMEAAKIRFPPRRVDATRAHLPDDLGRPADRLQCGFPSWSPLIAFPFQESVVQFHESENLPRDV